MDKRGQVGMEGQLRSGKAWESFQATSLEHGPSRLGLPVPTLSPGGLYSLYVPFRYPEMPHEDRGGTGVAAASICGSAAPQVFNNRGSLAL